MPPHPVDTHVGKRVQLRRNMLGFSQDYLGKKTGVTFQQIQKYERGINRIGSGRLFDFSQILKVPIGYFFEGFNVDSTKNTIGCAESSSSEDKFNNKETLSLVRAYYGITDPIIRRKVLNLMKVINTESGEKPD